MAYKFLAPDALIPIPVKGYKLNENGKEEPFDFFANVLKMSADDWAKWNLETSTYSKQLRSPDPLNALNSDRGNRDVELGLQVIKGWVMLDINGVEIPFTDANLLAVLQDFPVSDYFYLAYQEMMGKARAKTFGKQRSG